MLLWLRVTTAWGTAVRSHSIGRLRASAVDIICCCFAFVQCRGETDFGHTEQMIYCWTTPSQPLHRQTGGGLSGKPCPWLSSSSPLLFQLAIILLPLPFTFDPGSHRQALNSLFLLPPPLTGASHWTQLTPHFILRDRREHCGLLRWHPHRWPWVTFKHFSWQFKKPKLLKKPKV